MKLAKRIINIEESRLEGILGLPEGVEITNIVRNNGEVEFTVMSVGPKSLDELPVTVYQEGPGQFRKLPYEKIYEARKNKLLNIIKEELLEGE